MMFLNKDQVRANIVALKKFMENHSLDAFYISSFDQYLNEYVPMEDCHRYYLTGFNGSTAEALILIDGKVRLYVDGRYYEQADLQVDADDVEVIKVPANEGLAASLLKDVIEMNVQKIGLESDRTSFSHFEKLQKLIEVVAFANGELSQIIDFSPMAKLKEVELVSEKFCGESTAEKLERISLGETEGYFLTALDDVAWISNCRGYHTPHQSAFRARALLVNDKVYIFIEEGCPVGVMASKQSELNFISSNQRDMKKTLASLRDSLSLDKVYYDSQLISAADFDLIESVFSEDVIQQKSGGLVPFRSIKTAKEMIHIEDGFNRSNKAIYQTIVWARNEIKSGRELSELALAEKCKESYLNQGALELSFGTIAAVGANGSIIHYATPSNSVFAKTSDLLLLDSGAYYEGGFATDTTRTFLASGDSALATDEHKKIYTLVLKGLLQALNAVVPEGTWGSVVDGLARTPLTRFGYNYNHGTGHGIGINVHEAGARFSPISNVPVNAGQLVSIEPGIYVPGFGGVRLENIVIVEKHPTFPGMVHFRNLVWIGFDNSLIDQSLLSSEEIIWLKDYEQECSKRGTSFSQI